MALKHAEFAFFLWLLLMKNIFFSKCIASFTIKLDSFDEKKLLN